MRSNDVRYMAELSKLVPVVPVIMKADTMTIQEAQVFRQEVHARLNNPGRESARL
jgi:septin family protein